MILLRKCFIEDKWNMWNKSKQKDKFKFISVRLMEKKYILDLGALYEKIQKSLNHCCVKVRHEEEKQ